MSKRPRAPFSCQPKRFERSLSPVARGLVKIRSQRRERNQTVGHWHARPAHLLHGALAIREIVAVQEGARLVQSHEWRPLGAVGRWHWSGDAGFMLRFVNNGRSLCTSGCRRRALPRRCSLRCALCPLFQERNELPADIGRLATPRRTWFRNSFGDRRRNRQIRRNRRTGYVIMAAIAVALPGVDPVTTMMEMVPLWLLFEGSIWAAVFFEKRWAAQGVIPDERLAEG